MGSKLHKFILTQLHFGTNHTNAFKHVYITIVIVSWNPTCRRQCESKKQNQSKHEIFEPILMGYV